MIILSIETSCDETAISILDCENQNVNILAHTVHTQIEMHKEYGGVFPTVAKREHALNLVPVLIQSLSQAKLPTSQLEITKEVEEKIKKILERENGLAQTFLKFIKENEKPEIDLIAVTEGPGLEPALWVGICFAKALSLAWNIPLVPVNHMEGHIVSALLLHKNKSEATIQEIEFPSLALLISGGHTELVKVNKIGDYEIVGRTRDDAVGEAFDKVARLLGLPYPGGPEISRLAQSARENDSPISYQLKTKSYSLPRPMIHSDDLDFSFSGIKTAVRYMVEKIPEMTDEIKKCIAKEFEDAVIDVLISKTKKALDFVGSNTLIVGGGVIANKLLRERLEKEVPEAKIYIPDTYLTGDNATMIGISAFLQKKTPIEPQNREIRAQGSLSLDKIL